MNYRPVMTKRDFVYRYKKGEFGNAAPTWDYVIDFISDPNTPSGPFHLRNRIVGGPTYYDLSEHELVEKYQLCLANGGRSGDYYVSAMAPTEKTVIQGEVMQGYNSLNLHYSTIKKPMRDALSLKARTVVGVHARMMLDQTMCPNSRGWLDILLDRYHGHVIEFSVYDCEWGTVPGFNTVFWEVRNY